MGNPGLKSSFLCLDLKRSKGFEKYGPIEIDSLKPYTGKPSRKTGGRGARPTPFNLASLRISNDNSKLKVFWKIPALPKI